MTDYLACELVRHEGLDGRIWFILWSLEPNTRKRLSEIARTTDRQAMLELIYNFITA